MESQQVTPGSIANPVKFGGQDYVALLDACVKSGSLFSDPTFTPDQSSIGMPTDPDPKKEIKWLRPKRIWQYVQPTWQLQTTCSHNSPGPPHLASASSETSHLDR
ncbi:unnamed protein product [Oncorhynchus mykiss]|uniref:Uncharacterized protein n=1 Tax=Oncorhynchus mykiss TaxID=8022 RepID=A0A060XCW1_ONCMY|nr:unnamed protein product [Oncorhynchus mykiss]